MALSPDQEQTKDAFSFKWARRSTYDSPEMARVLRDWLLEKYFDADEQGPSRLLQSRSNMRILDAGCGAGLSAGLLFGPLLNEHNYLGVDISDSVVEAELRFQEAGLHGRFMQGDILNLDVDLGGFDLIFSEGVLHHTDSVEQAVSVLSRRLRPGGIFMFYVYRLKAPTREFTDDLVRQEIGPLDDADAWRALVPLTKLGLALGKLNETIELEEAIPYLGIEAGTHDVQRLFYYAFVKAFYHPDLTLDELNHINFDWFRPRNCHRHTPDQIRGFVEDAGLAVLRIHTDSSGISVIARRD